MGDRLQTTVYFFVYIYHLPIPNHIGFVPLEGLKKGTGSNNSLFPPERKGYPLYS